MMSSHQQQQRQQQQGLTMAPEQVSPCKTQILQLRWRLMKGKTMQSQQ
jgi:hypothetical protein